jgi:hypothetical protein
LLTRKPTNYNMAQPNPALLAQGAATLSDQFALFGNLPAFDGGAAIIQRLDALSQQLTNLGTNVASLRTDVTSLRTDVTSLRTDVTSLRTDMTNLGTELRAKYFQDSFHDLAFAN